MAGTSRKRQDTSENPKSRAKNSKSREASSSGRGASSGNNKRKETTGTRGTSRRKAESRSMEPEENSFIAAEVAIIVMFAISVLLFLSNFHLCGVVGDFFRTGMLGSFGRLGYIFPIFLCVGSCFYASNRGNRRAVIKLAAALVTFFALCGLAQMVFGGGYEMDWKLLDYFKQDAESPRGGGFAGGVLVVLFSSTVGTIGAYLILLVLFAIGIICITEKSLVGAVKRGGDRAYRYARDDMDRRREIYEERREERREERHRMREEKARGIDMDAATLIGYPSDYEDLDGSREEKAARKETRKNHLRDHKDYVLEPEEEPFDPADIFRGSITMPDIPEEESEKYNYIEETHSMRHESRRGKLEKEKKTEQVERKALEGEKVKTREEEISRRPLDEISDEGFTIPEETVLHGREEEDSHLSPKRPLVSRKRGSAHSEALRCSIEEEEKLRGENHLDSRNEAEGLADSEDTVLPYPGERYTDTPVEEEQLLKSIYAGRDTRTFAELDITEDFSASSQEDEIQYELIDADGQEESQKEPEENLDISRAINESPRKELEEREASEVTCSSEPETITSSGSFYAPEQEKRVVTASGKVIETDTDLVRKTIEKKREANEERVSQPSAASFTPSAQPPILSKPVPEKKPYVFPPLDLLKRGKQVGTRSEQSYRETAIKLQQTLKNFGVGVTVTNISCGPAVTRYELHPEQGVKVSKIVSLSDDIKLNLAAADIRIEAPIPGKAAVGIEVPNKETETVLLRDLLESESFKKASSKLSFAVGKDIAGQTVVTDIGKMPHLLIAGATGSGKSVCINTLIMSIIYKADPEDVKLIMIDPKVVELSVYNGIPHLLIPVVTDPKKASGALNWAVAEMTDRYQKFAKYNVRDLKGYNEKIQTIDEIEDENKPKKLPQIIIIVDELADLMMVAPGEVEDSICRLAQLARAAGIHLVIATQRPSVNVITGLIKANIPSRIAFSVSSGVDSRTIIDMNGAEKLLGKGDMLFYPQGIQKPQRVQGAFVSDQEVSRVVEFLAEQGLTTEYDPEVEKKMNAPIAGIGADGASDRDAYFEQAARFIIDKDKASIGMLQRMLKIGFNRAARIMDQLSDAGVVGEDEGTKPRKVLMSMEEFEELLEQGY